MVRSTELAVTLHTANFPELNEIRYVAYEGPFDKAAGAFCAGVVTILDRLPTDEEELTRAFEKDDLGGKRVDQYASWAHRGKFDAFREFVKQHFQQH
jgi:hypothetical protein